jgi:predicted ester cyclase
MMMRKPLSALGLFVLTLAACAEQQPAAGPLAAPPPAEPAPLAVAPAPAAEPAKEAPKVVELTPVQNAKVYQDCWAAFNAKDWAKFSPCFAENATSEQVDMGMPPQVGKDIVEKSAKPFAAAFPDGSGEAQLTLVNGNNILGVWLMRGTQKGPLPGPTGEIPATNKKIGYLVGHSIELKGGKAVHERMFADAHTMLGQLGLTPGPVRKVMEQGAAEKPVVIATGSDAEKINVETYKKYTDAFGKHDAAAMDALVADDFVFSDQTSPADLVGKKEAVRGMKEIWKAMSDVRMDPTSAWAAGDYVVTSGTFSGTNDGPLPSMKLYKKTGKHVAVNYLSVAKLQGGKLKNEWVFGNGMAFAAQLGLLPPEKPAKAAPADKSAAAKPAAPAGPGAAKPEAGKPGASATLAAAGTPPAKAEAAKPGAAAAAKPTTPAPAVPAKAEAAKPAAPAAPAAPTKPATPAAPAKPTPPAAPATPAAPAPK